MKDELWKSKLLGGNILKKLFYPYYNKDRTYGMDGMDGMYGMYSAFKPLSMYGM